MNYGSLFSGIGGFDLALSLAGFEPAWMCEIDKSCQNILRRQFEGVKIFDDVRSIGKNNAESVDLICGGFPCQDLSIAGKRAGLAGERSGLWFEFERIIGELNPKWVVIENVPGLLSSKGGFDFSEILRGLVERGYGVSWRILDAQYFGVPQRRRRVFIVGSFGNGCSAEVLFERESSAWNITPSGYSWDSNSYNIARSITTNEEQRQKVDQETYIVSTVDDGRKDRPNGGMYVNKTELGNGISSKSEVLVAWTIRGGKEGGGKGYLGNDNQAMTLGGQQQFVGVRRLTPTECERLQGFPDGWTEGQSDSTRYRQLGNAVAVPVVEWIVKRIAQAALQIPMFSMAGDVAGEE